MEAPTELDRDCKVGQLVCWKTISGQEHEGVLIEWDSNVAIVKTLDGNKAVEC